jgi:hypothetical protein
MKNGNFCKMKSETCRLLKKKSKVKTKNLLTAQYKAVSTLDLAATIARLGSYMSRFLKTKSLSQL